MKQAISTVTRLEAMMKEHRNWSTKLSKPAGLVLHHWLTSHSIKCKADWYKSFYNRCILRMEGYPMSLPIDWVLTEYVRGIDYGYVDLLDNEVESHRVSIHKWLWEYLGFYARRDLLFKKYDGDLPDLDKDRVKDFQFTANRKNPTKKTSRYSRRLKVHDENQASLM